MRQDRSGRLLMVAAGLICVIALASVLISAAFVGTMGVVVVASALFLHPRHVAILGALSVLLALGMIPLELLDGGAVRAINVTVGCTVAVVLALALARRLSREEALRAREEAILSSIPDAVVVVDGQGVIQRANDELVRLVPGAAQGQALHPLLGHELADRSECPGSCTLAGNVDAAPNGVEWISPTGRRIPVSISTAELDESCMVLTLRDVTDQLNADADRRALIEEASRQAAQDEAIRSIVGAGLQPIPGMQIDLWTGGPGGPWPGSVDVREMDDGRVLILVAEAQGDPIQAARDSWRAMYVARAHASAGVPMAELMERTAITLDAEPQTTRAAMLALSVDPDTGFITVVGAGHPPALLVRSPGRSEWLAAMGRALGSESPGSTNLIVRTLETGDSLVLFSDGTLSPEDKLASLSALRAAAVALRSKSSTGWSQKLAQVVAPKLEGSCMVLMARLSTAEADNGRKLPDDPAQLIASLGARPRRVAGPVGPP